MNRRKLANHSARNAGLEILLAHSMANAAQFARIVEEKRLGARSAKSGLRLAACHMAHANAVN